MPLYISTRRSLHNITAVAAPAAPGWTPASLTNLQLWLDPTTGTPGATTSGDAVATWNDQSANTSSVVQATSGKKPTLGAFPNSARGISFVAASSQYLQAASTTPLNSILNDVASGYYVAIAFHFTGNTSDSYHALMSHNNGVDAALFFLREAATGKMQRFNAVKTASAYGTTGGTPHVLVYSYDGAAESITMDGGSVDTGGAATPSGVVTTNHLTIGATDDEGFPWQGLIGDVIVGSGAIGSTDRTNLTSYLKTKYGVS